MKRKTHRCGWIAVILSSSIRLSVVVMLVVMVRNDTVILLCVVDGYSSVTELFQVILD